MIRSAFSNEQREKELVGKEQHRAIAKDMAKKSIVLLKNKDGILPLSKNTKDNCRTLARW